MVLEPVAVAGAEKFLHFARHCSQQADTDSDHTSAVAPGEFLEADAPLVAAPDFDQNIDAAAETSFDFHSNYNPFDFDCTNSDRKIVVLELDTARSSRRIAAGRKNNL